VSNNKNTLDYSNVVEFYLSAYEEGWSRTTKNTYGHRKADAKRYADSVCPEGLDLIKASLDYAKNGGLYESPEVLAGRKIVAGIKSSCFAHKNDDDDDDDDDDVVVVVNGNVRSEKTTREKFEAACALGFIPSNSVLSALLDIDPSYASRLRTGQDNYTFAQVENGYSVTLKSTEKDIAIKDLKAQMAAMSKKLASLESM
ncbi:MAG: hypothetical protein KC474_12310, partial [Cyanobacteria bacterium HKST-UBA04]|nr:hypothetical protein [Cyanobacteria bacterium HKST-UBA04]